MDQVLDIANFLKIYNANQPKQHFRAQDTHKLEQQLMQLKAARELGKQQYIVIFTWAGTFSYLFSSALFFCKKTRL